MKISLISPIYNEENCLEGLLKKINQYYDKFEFEWIFIDDNSTDKSFKILKDFSHGKNKIKLIKNPGLGKVDAINEGFKISKGAFIKLVGGDDEIDLSFINLLNKYDDGNTSLVHNGKIVDEHNREIGSYIPPYQMFNYSLDKYILNNISCPSWCWIFPRKKAASFFPIPKCEYEDLYLSFCIKKFTSITYIKKFYYTFKQNSGQTFGNILKFNDEIGEYRSKRSLKSLSILRNSSIFSLREKFLISRSRLYFIYYIKKKNIIQIFKSDLPFQRKIKLIILRYFHKIYKIIQLTKYKFDNYYHVLKKQVSSEIKYDLIDKSYYEFNKSEIKNKKLILVKSCCKYPTSDGFSNQYYNFIHQLSTSDNVIQAFFLCNKDFNQNEFAKKFKNLNNITFNKNFKSKFGPLIFQLLYLVLFHRLGIKKNHVFYELEKFSHNKNYNFYIHDISLYPLLFLNINKKKIIFSITDFQMNRLIKLILVSNNFIRSLYYFFGLIHCLFVESFVFRKLKKLHVFSEKDEFYLKKYLMYKNTISIPNFNQSKRSNTINQNFDFNQNNQKILIMGDLNQNEIFQGIKKLKSMKYFNKFEKNLIFVAKGNYNENTKNFLKKIFTNIEFQSSWISDDIYLNYLDSFKLLLFVDKVEFGLSNRVVDALKSYSLTVGLESAFTGYDIKNFSEVIFLKNFFDLFYAFNLHIDKKTILIKNANYLSKKYDNDLIKHKWNSIL